MLKSMVMIPNNFIYIWSQPSLIINSEDVKGGGRAYFLRYYLNICLRGAE